MRFITTLSIANGSVIGAAVLTWGISLAFIMLMSLVFAFKRED